jgi:hypothetical protein
MRQHDPQLVIQLVKELAELWIEDGGFHSHRVRDRPGPYAECPVVAACATELFADAGRAFASRHNESAKMRIEPPAVRTYSTFPAEIQL